VLDDDLLGVLIVPVDVLVLLFTFEGFAEGIALLDLVTLDLSAAGEFTFRVGSVPTLDLELE
jgi:hypothetical protein